MTTVNYVAGLDLEGCTGCKWCDIVCPSGAITVRSKKAFIDGDGCIGCSRCVDKCPEDVMWMAPRREPLVKTVPLDVVPQEEVRRLLDRAQLQPTMGVCACTLTTAAEIAAAVVKGARTLEDVSAMTGIRSGCGIYCVAPALRLLKEAGADMTPPKGHRWYNLTLSLWDLEGGPLDGAEGTYVREDIEAFDPSGDARRLARRDDA
jgi:Pyruvate/2-oxoacid:ferredoxin oxidoreductase delta subunit/bacterioferritin-associated ferredoxin